MYGYIYKITNLTNNKIYIGKHKYPKKELDPRYFCGGIEINRAIRKYGKENFKAEIIDTAETEKELNEKEIYNIKKYNSLTPVGYNITEGGDGISHPSDIVKQKISASKTGKKLSEEHKRKIKETLKKVVHTKEWVDKISSSLKGRKPSKKTLDAAAEKNRGAKYCNNGVVERKYKGNLPEGFVEGKLKNPFPSPKGNKLSEETKSKISKSKSDTIWYHNMEKEIMLKIGSPIPDGFVKGRLKRRKR